MPINSRASLAEEEHTEYQTSYRQLDGNRGPQLSRSPSETDLSDSRNQYKPINKQYCNWKLTTCRAQIQAHRHACLYTCTDKPTGQKYNALVAHRTDGGGGEKKSAAKVDNNHFRLISFTIGHLQKHSLQLQYAS